MRRIKFSLLALFALTAVFAASAASASAFTLAEFTVETAATSSQTVTLTFENSGFLKGTVTSSSLTSSQTPTNKKEGTFTIDFAGSKCVELGKTFTAKSTGDASGTILVAGTYKIVGEAATGNETAEVDLELSPTVKIECEGSAPVKKIEVRGSVIGKLAKEGAAGKGKSFALTIKTVGGAQEITEYDKDNGEKVKDTLETSIGGGFEASTQNESAAVTLTTTSTTELT